MRIVFERSEHEDDAGEPMVKVKSDRLISAVVIGPGRMVTHYPPDMELHISRGMLREADRVEIQVSEF